MKVWDSVKSLFLPSMASPSSYSPPNVTTLHEWWLTSLKTNDGRDAIGVEGITTPIFQNQAERYFTSAPILKAFDYHGLETVDGIHIILDGNIDKDRTLKNGFPPEVFDHFKIGFPQNWEEFAVDTRVQGHDHTVFSNETITVPDASSLIVPHEDTIEAGHGVLCEQSPLTSYIEDDPSVRMSPLNIVVHNMKHNVTRNDLGTISKCSGVSGSKSRSLLVQNIDNLDKVTPIDPVKLENTDIFWMDKTDVISNTKAGNRDEKKVGISQDMDNRKDLVVRRKKLTLEVGILNQIAISPKSARTISKAEKKKNRKGRSSSPYREGTCHAAAAVAVGHGMDSQEGIMTRSKSKRKLTSESLADRQLIPISHESAKTISKAKKKKNRKGRSSSPYREGTCHAAAAVAVGHGMDSQEGIMTRSKSKRKLTSESLADRQLIPISHESAKTISKAKKGSKVIMLSPESFGGRKSRSGRVLLPRLEFWRNQIVVYDPMFLGLAKHLAEKCSEERKGRYSS